MRKDAKEYMFFIAIIFFIAITLSGCDQLPPNIKNGEFPFHLKYEYNGKVYDIADTVICEFSGFDISGGFGKFRTWNEYLKSGNSRMSILSDYNVASVLNSGRVDTKIEVYIDYGKGMYYMGDPNAISAEHGEPHICYVETYDETPKMQYIYATPITAKQAEEYFEIKIIEWSFSKPIKNTFQ